MLGLEHTEYEEEHKTGFEGRQDSRHRRPYRSGEGVRTLAGRLRAIWKTKSSEACGRRTDIWEPHAGSREQRQNGVVQEVNEGLGLDNGMEK